MSLSNSLDIVRIKSMLDMVENKWDYDSLCMSEHECRIVIEKISARYQISGEKLAESVMLGDPLPNISVYDWLLALVMYAFIRRWQQMVHIR